VLLGGLYDYAFDDVGDVFAFIYRGLDDFEDFFPLDDLHRVFFFVKKLRDQSTAEAVAIVLVAIDFNAVLQGLVGSFNRMHGGGNFRACGDEYFDEVDGAFADCVDAIENEATGGVIDQVDYVIQLAGQGVNIFAVKRRDKSLVELGENGVGDFVALMLDGLDGLDLLGHAGVMREHLLERFGSDDDIFGLLGKKVEETLFTRQQPLQKSSHFGNSPLGVGAARLEESSEGRTGRQGRAG